MVLPPKVCPECDAEYLGSATTCAECDVPLVHAEELEPLGELPPVSELVCVRSAGVAWARSYSERLSEAGISHRIEAGGGPPGAPESSSCQVFVRPEDAEAAAEVDALHLRTQIPDLPDAAEEGEADLESCPACGVSVSADARECSSCGLALVVAG